MTDGFQNYDKNFIKNLVSKLQDNYVAFSIGSKDLEECFAPMGDSKAIFDLITDVEEVKPILSKYSKETFFRPKKVGEVGLNGHYERRPIKTIKDERNRLDIVRLDYTGINTERIFVIITPYKERLFDIVNTI